MNSFARMETALGLSDSDSDEGNATEHFAITPSREKKLTTLEVLQVIFLTP